jgi:Flp pilus assembly protein TadD
MTRETQKFLDQNPLCKLLAISESVLRDCAIQGYEMCKAGRYADAEVVGRGLVAADHRDWYFRTLLAVPLAKLGRKAEAIQVIDEGLRFHPGHRDLVALRASLS